MENVQPLYSVSIDAYRKNIVLVPILPGWMVGIIDSMTREERNDIRLARVPERTVRIARGAGVSTERVLSLMKLYQHWSDLMVQLAMVDPSERLSYVRELRHRHQLIPRI